jgi:hypothetical protein
MRTRSKTLEVMGGETWIGSNVAVCLAKMFDAALNQISDTV